MLRSSSGRRLAAAIVAAVALLVSILVTGIAGPKARRRVLRPPNGAVLVRISPLGDFVAFETWDEPRPDYLHARPGKPELRIWRLGNRGSENWALQEGLRELAVSPDGESIATISGADGDLHLISLAGQDGEPRGASRRVAALPGPPMDLAWSPNGEWITFTAFHPRIPHQFFLDSGEVKPLWSEEQWVELTGPKLGPPQSPYATTPLYLPTPDDRPVLVFLVQFGPLHNHLVAFDFERRICRVLGEAGYLGGFSNGHLVYKRDAAIRARPFALSTLEFEGPELVIVEREDLGIPSVSRNGTLAYRQYSKASKKSDIVVVENWYEEFR